MQACRIRTFAAVILLLLLGALPALAADPLTGTWILNVQKSKYGTGAPPKSQTTKLDANDRQLHEIVERINADGTKTQWDVTAQFDGKDYPVTGDPSRDTVSLTRVDANTIQVTNKKAGAVTTRMTIAVAPGGKTRTNTVQGTDAAGKAFTSVMVFERK